MSIATAARVEGLQKAVDICDCIKDQIKSKGNSMSLEDMAKYVAVQDVQTLILEEVIRALGGNV